MIGGSVPGSGALMTVAQKQIVANTTKYALSLNQGAAGHYGLYKKTSKSHCRIKPTEEYKHTVF